MNREGVEKTDGYWLAGEGVGSAELALGGQPAVRLELAAIDLAANEAVKLDEAGDWKTRVE